MTLLLKLGLSAILGALIGFERENKNRPAGLRTNILVCVGAALVQIISIDIYNQYKGITNLDPGRLSAQVISGIGFLGAGTILREGATIKGLTTAAGLWVVACIGIAIGNGSYAPGIMTAIFAYITLKALKGIERKVSKRNPYLEIQVELENKPGQIGKIGQLLGSMHVNIRNMEFLDNEGDRLNIYFSLKIPVDVEKHEVVNRLMKEEGVYSVEQV